MLKGKCIEYNYRISFIIFQGIHQQLKYVFPLKWKKINNKNL